MDSMRSSTAFRRLLRGEFTLGGLVTVLIVIIVVPL